MALSERHAKIIPLFASQSPVMRIEITTAYSSQYPDPICFEAGEMVQVERGDPDFPGWFWCRSKSGKEGWVHQSFLAADSGSTTSIDAYTARELTVTGGEHGNLLRTLAGWAYIRLDGGEEGWIPQSHTTPISQNNSDEEMPENGMSLRDAILGVRGAHPCAKSTQTSPSSS